MGRLLSICAVLVAGVGAQHCYKFMKRHAKSHTLRRRLEVWEGEGGAVPVSRRRTAAQVAPRRASPGTDR